MIKRKITYVIAGNIVPMAAAVLAVPIIINKAGLDVFAILTFIWMIIGYFSFIEFGVSTALTHKIAIYSNNKEGQITNKIIIAGLLFTLFIGVAASLLLLLSANYIVSQWMNVRGELYSPSVLALRLAAIAIPLTTLSAGIRGILEGYQEFKNVSIIKAIFNSAIYTLPILFASDNINSISYMAGSLVAARAAMLLAYSHALLSKNNQIFTIYKDTLHEVQNLLRYGAWIAASNIITQATPIIERFFISKIINISSVSIYSVPYDTLMRLMVVPASLATVLLPILSIRHSLSTSINEKTTIFTTIKVMLFGSCIFIPIALLSEDILSLWINVVFAKEAAEILQILSIGCIFVAAAHIPLTSMQGCGKTEVVTRLYLMEAIVYIPVFYIALNKYGLKGAAITWLIRSVLDLIFLLIVEGKLMRNVVHGGKKI